MIGSLRVVVDACALVPVSLCDALLSAADHRIYRPLWSDAILDEMERNAARLIAKSGRTAEDAALAARYRREQMTAAFPEAIVTGYAALIPAMSNNRKDRHVLAAAVHGSAQVIVTADLAGFPEASLAPLGITAHSPDDFLKNLLASDARAMRDVLCFMAASKSNPPMAPFDIVKRLSKTVPEFAAAAQQMIEDEAASPK